jgi:hypothetical protein
VPGGGTTGVAGVVVKPGLFVLPVVVLRICGGVVDPSDGVVKPSDDRSSPPAVSVDTYGSG